MARGFGSSIWKRASKVSVTKGTGGAGSYRLPTTAKGEPRRRGLLARLFGRG